MLRTFYEMNTERLAHIHFPKNEICFFLEKGLSKTRTSVENRKSKIFYRSILFSGIMKKKVILHIN